MNPTKKRSRQQLSPTEITTDSMVVCDITCLGTLINQSSCVISMTTFSQCHESFLLDEERFCRFLVPAIQQVKYYYLTPQVSDIRILYSILQHVFDVVFTRRSHCDIRVDCDTAKLVDRWLENSHGQENAVLYGGNEEMQLAKLARWSKEGMVSGKVLDNSLHTDNM